MADRFAPMTEQDWNTTLNVLDSAADDRREPERYRESYATAAERLRALLAASAPVPDDGRCEPCREGRHDDCTGDCPSLCCSPDDAAMPEDVRERLADVINRHRHDSPYNIAYFVMEEIAGLAARRPAGVEAGGVVGGQDVRFWHERACEAVTERDAALRAVERLSERLSAAPPRPAGEEAGDGEAARRVASVGEWLLRGPSLATALDRVYAGAVGSAARRNEYRDDLAVITRELPPRPGVDREALARVRDLLDGWDDTCSPPTEEGMSALVRDLRAALAPLLDVTGGGE